MHGSAATGGRTLLALQEARGVAALLVVLHHDAVTMAAAQYMKFVVLGGIFAPLGRAGVDLFFVLSGFIIYYVHHNDIGMPQRLPRYAARRLVRIYPTYWVVLLLFIIIYLAVPSFQGSPDRHLGVILRSFFLIPFTEPGQYTIVGVAWTLSHELLFYALFALWIVHRRLGTAVFCVWLLCLLVARLATSLPPPLNFFLHVKNLEFFIGMAVAHLVLAGRLRVGWGVLSVGAVAFLATGIVESRGFDFQQSSPTLCYGLAAGAMIFALASLEMGGQITRVPAPLLRLGAASYSIYLIHVLIVLVLLKAARLYGLTGYVLFLAVAAAATVGGLMLYAVVERPVLAWAHRYLARPRAAPPMPRGAASPQTRPQT